MSWQSYVDDHLMCEIDGNHLTSAAIIGHDGVVWAQSANFPRKACSHGLTSGWHKVYGNPGEPGAVIRGKKGAGGITVKKTNLALLIGIYDEPMTPGQCNMVVERIGDYLIEQGL
ncbi:hypothetical protein DH2020_025359 [Rehmannia glutinosa]|uniref:Profilin n=1 Tax=Rehmannia glutinosa TaxID=99300 RepID=A0ABR0VZX7_REHGL